MGLCLGLFADMGTAGDEFCLDLLIGGACKGWVVERAGPGLCEWRPLEAVYIALDAHLDGEELRAVGYVEAAPGAEIWARSHQGRAMGGQDGPGRRGRGKSAEGLARSCSVSCSICEHGSQPGYRSIPLPGCSWPEEQPLGQVSGAPQGEGTALSSVPASQPPPSSLPGPDEGRPPGQPSR